MRLVTVRTADGHRAGRVDGADVVALPFPDVGALLAAGTDAAALTGPRRPLADTELAPVIPAPRKIACLGHNYERHIAELGRSRPDHPTFFAKYAAALTGPRDPILLPAESVAVDWEAELAVVIGRPARRCSEEEAWSVIAGYTVMNDVSMRDWQDRTGQFLQGKTWERCTPLGPALVTLDELADPQDLAVRCEVDGVVMQDARTSDMLFGPARVVAYLSTVVTLEPGDVIATGTPAGVGAGRRPPVFLRPGNVVRTSVQDVGELLNTCLAEPVG